MKRLIKMVLKPDVVITIVFLILKLTNVISWSWWWIISPIIIPVIILIIFKYIKVLIQDYIEKNNL
jgi:hypothetical protein